MAYEAEIEKLQRRYDEKPEQWFAALADAYRKAGDVQLAEDVVRQGIERRPNYVSGHIVLGRCLVDQEMDEQATEVFEQVLGLDAENIIALKSLAEIAQRAGDYGQATDWMNRLLEVDPGNEEAVALLEQLQSGPPAAVDEGTAEPEALPEDVPATSVAGAAAAGAPPAPIEPVAEIGPPPEADVAPPSPEVEQDAAAGAGDDGSPASPIDTHAATMLVSAAPEDAFAPPPDWQPASATPAEAEAATGESTGDDQGEPAESVGDIFGDDDAGTGVPDDDAGAVVPDTEKPTAEMMADPRPEPFAGQEDVGFAAADTDIGDVVQEEDPMRIAGERPSSVDMVIGVELSREEGGAESLTVREDTTDELLPGDPSSPGGGDAEADYEVSTPSPRFAWANDVQPPAGPGPEEDKEVEPPAVVEDVAEEAGGPPPGEVVTETMAEVYAQQGLFAQARSVYERLLEQQPDSADLRQRLQDLLQREQVAETGAPSGRGRILSASATGGTSVRELFQGLLEARPGAVAVVTSAPEAPPEPAPDENDEPPPLEQAFEGDDVSRGAPTRPAGDEPSLSTVFGTSEAATRESIPTPVPPDAEPSSGKEGMSFDAFYGQQPPPEESEADAEEGDDEEDFKDWLTSLKS